MKNILLSSPSSRIMVSAVGIQSVHIHGTTVLTADGNFALSFSQFTSEPTQTTTLLAGS